MVDITEKKVIYREATAEGIIKLRKETLDKIMKKEVEKGDVFEITKATAIQGAKLTPQLLPFCHPIRLTNVKVHFERVDLERLKVRVTVKAVERTGVEMEALTAVSLALLNIWDMVKKYEKDERGQYPHTAIESIRVIEKVKDENRSRRDVENI